MTRRSDALLPLTHDHHHALAHARRLRLAAKESAEVRVDQARSFLDFFRSDTLAHFREEEEFVFPLVVHEPEAVDALSRLMLDHLRIHAAVHQLRGQVEESAVAGETLARIASQLEEHIRFEEKTMFPLIEQIAANELHEVELTPRDRSRPDP